jgi:hypothetical protein
MAMAAERRDRRRSPPRRLRDMIAPHRRAIRAVLPVLVAVGLACGCTAPAPQAACGTLGTRPMLVAELYFGRAVEGAPEVSEEDWRGFLDDTLARAFPDGLTVLEAEGRWRNARRDLATGERSKLVIVALPDAPDALRRIEAVRQGYAARFRQKQVGLVLDRRCAEF